MKVTVRVDQADSHVHFRVFVNGALAGNLVLRAGAEFQEFADRLQAGVQGNMVIAALVGPRPE